MESMKYGYARVSTDDQTPALQLAALKKAVCKTIFKDEGVLEPSATAPPFRGASRNSNPATRSSSGSSID